MGSVGATLAKLFGKFGGVLKGPLGWLATLLLEPIIRIVIREILAEKKEEEDKAEQRRLNDAALKKYDEAQTEEEKKHATQELVRRLSAQ